MKVRKPRPEPGPAANGKCFDCICALESPKGKWCVRKKRVPTREQARICKQRMSPVLLRELGTEEEEGR